MLFKKQVFENYVQQPAFAEKNYKMRDLWLHN